MPPLPVVSGVDAVQVFQRAGWAVARRHSSHIILTRPETAVNLSIPDHRTLDRGLLRKLIRASGLSVEQFVELLE